MKSFIIFISGIGLTILFWFVFMLLPNIDIYEEMCPTKDCGVVPCYPDCGVLPCEPYWKIAPNH